MQGEISVQEAVEMAMMRLRELQALKQHPGWRLFDAVAQGIEDTCYNAAIAANDGIKQAKMLGAHKTAKDLRTWLDREIADLKRYVEAAQAASTSQPPR